MNKHEKKIFTYIIVISCILIAMALLGTILSRFNYQDHLDETVITVDDTEITLREFGCYIYEVEAFVQKQALIYDPENPKHWWNTHFSAGMDSQFVCDLAKKAAINTCILEEIYSKKAASEGITLDIAEEKQALEEAKVLYNSMNSEQIRRTGLDEDIIIEIRRKHALASKYSALMEKSLNFAGFSEEPKELLDWDGAYFQEKILPEHMIEMNDKVLDKITLGKITVNYE
ncbi:MAG: hypothetical protein E7307_01915 [Butyrivibrio sp.]|nr:hypothetical protein [Butyrivibrio sp.]